jgi:hypothetical protein
VATSGSWDFGRTAAQVIASAMENLGVIAPGGTVASADSTMALARLNMIAKEHSGPIDGAPGLKIHTRQRVTLMFAKGQQAYLIGPASTDARASTSVGRTTLSAAEASGQTVLSITSNTDTTSYPGSTLTMANTDIVGIELDDGTIQWTTISGTPGATMTVAVALTGDAASGNHVWWFTSRAQRLVHVESVVLRDESMNDTPLTVYRDIRQYELGVSSKNADGTPTSVLVEPLRIATRLTFDTQPTDVTDTVVITGWYPQEDYDATSDDIAFPQEAFRWLTWELAAELAPVYVRQWSQDMESRRQEARATYFNLNPETCDLYFQPGGY